MGIEGAVEFSSAAQFDQWMADHHAGESQLWAAILKKSTKRQTVGFGDLLEIALCWGWVDVQTKGIDDDWYGIRFVPRKPGSNWSDPNRSTACRMVAAERMQPPGTLLLPPDLVCTFD